MPRPVPAPPTFKRKSLGTRLRKKLDRGVSLGHLNLYPNPGNGQLDIVVLFQTKHLKIIVIPECRQAIFHAEI